MQELMILQRSTRHLQPRHMAGIRLTFLQSQVRGKPGSVRKAIFLMQLSPTDRRTVHLVALYAADTVSLKVSMISPQQIQNLLKKHLDGILRLSLVDLVFLLPGSAKMDTFGKQKLMQERAKAEDAVFVKTKYFSLGTTT